MTGRLFEVDVYDVLNIHPYSYALRKTDTNNPQPPEILGYLRDDDVGIVIFSLNQQPEMERFKKENNFDIIFEGPPCFNNNYLVYKVPRLFPFIIKKKTDVKDSVV